MHIDRDIAEKFTIPECAYTSVKKTEVSKLSDIDSYISAFRDHFSKSMHMHVYMYVHIRVSV